MSEANEVVSTDWLEGRPLIVANGDCMDVLRTMPDDYVQCCVTSPPYWGAQRDYGHKAQLGMERTPEEYTQRLVAIFREVRRVLRSDGCMWLNLGDSYAASGKGGGGKLMKKRGEAWGHRDRMRGWRAAPPGYKEKDLVGIPWMVAFALRADGWYLRRDVVWEKTVPTEPTRADRPCNAHEMLFLFSKKQDYRYRLAERQEGTVWRIASDGGFGEHSATMPEALAARCILRGSAEGDLILDPFGGAGTTGKMAVELRRRAVLIELNPDYVRLCNERCTTTIGLPLAL